MTSTLDINNRSPNFGVLLYYFVLLFHLIEAQLHLAMKYKELYQLSVCVRFFCKLFVPV